MTGPCQPARLHSLWRRPTPLKPITRRAAFCFTNEQTGARRLGSPTSSGSKVDSAGNLGSSMMVANSTDLPCDGCGQAASPEHIARRLRRLEWATRHRPVHIRSLLLGGVAPREDAEFLYAPGNEFRGEAGDLLGAVGVSTLGKARAEVHGAFQAAGFFLTHLLECPVECPGEQRRPYSGQTGHTARDPATLLREHLPSIASRIRRSLKPRRVMLVSEVPPAVVEDLLSMDLGCPVVLDQGRPFWFGPSSEAAGLARFRALLEA